MRRIIMTMALVLSALAAAYALGQDQPAKTCPPAPADGSPPLYVEGQAKDPGSLSGRVLFSGQYTPMKWKVDKDRDFCGDTVIDEGLVAAADGGLRWVAVFIDDIREGKALPRRVVELANQECRYQPHVITLSLCDKLMVTNHDPILHNSHAYLGESVFDPVKPTVTPEGHWMIASGEAAGGDQPLAAFTTLFNLGLPNQDFKPKKTMKETGLITVKCDAGHTWMTGFIWVKPHPYHAVTGEGGKFTIGEIPAGERTVTFWHERLGTQTKKVTIRPGETASVEVTFTLK